MRDMGRYNKKWGREEGRSELPRGKEKIKGIKTGGEKQKATEGIISYQ